MTPLLDRLLRLTRPAVLTALVLALSVAAASAQGISTLTQMPAQYSLEGFEYVPPQGEGWREITSSPSDLHIVYAERVDENAINTRLEFRAHASKVPDGATAPEPFALTMASFQQRKGERGDAVVASSNIEVLADTAGVYTYTLVTRLGDKDVFEVFYVLVAPDRTSYLAAKMLTQDTDYDSQPYFAPFLASLKTWKPPAAAQDASPSNPQADDASKATQEGAADTD